MYYSSYSILAIILTLIINHNVLWGRIEGDVAYAKTKYKFFLMCIMLYYVVDILWGFLYDAHLIGLTYADTAAYFFLMALSIVLWMHYIVAYIGGRNLFTALITYSGLFYLIYVVVALIINFFVPIMFYFDADGVYCVGSLRYVTLIIQLVFFLVAAIHTLIVAIKAQGKLRRHNFAIGISSVAMILFILFQTFFPFMAFYAIGCLVATCIVHTFIVNDDLKSYDKKLDKTTHKMYTDPLTGVKSNHAYLESVAKVNECLSSGELDQFAVAIFDLNDVKKVNDTKGHEMGNKYIQFASQMICRQFKHSPVYRIGGDEFVVLLTGEDYNNRISLFGTFNAQIEKNVEENSIMAIATGYSDYIPEKDKYYGMIFERADKKMYERKKYLKQMAKNRSQEN